MNVLIVAATGMELAPFRKAIAESGERKYKHLSISLLTTGVGMLSTGICLTRHLQKSTPDLMIQAGIGGSFLNNVVLGDVYTISSEAIADLGVRENGNWNDIFDLKLAGADDAPFTGGLLEGADKKFSALAGFKAVPGITVNEITTKAERIAELQAKYNPAIESMEGAAFHWVGIDSKIPFVQIRAVSNYVGERNKGNWMMKEAISNLNMGLHNLLTTINDSL
jgi:futalosine hydrolase